MEIADDLEDSQSGENELNDFSGADLSEADEIFFDRLSEYLGQSAPTVQVDPDAVAEAVIAALDARDLYQREQAEAELQAGEEILVPEAGEITIIAEGVQALLSYFQEDDNEILSDIRGEVRGIKQYLENQEAVNSDLHMMMTTDFSDYTVTEGLLLLILLYYFLGMLGRMLREAFSWLI